MTDKSFPDEPEKTTAERESEARERARAAMAYQEPEQKTPPGQPRQGKRRPGMTGDVTSRQIVPKWEKGCRG